MANINLENTYWEEIIGFVSEFRVDKRWKLCNEKTEKSIGSLRIASHPDLKPGHLRASFTYITKINSKTDSELLQTLEDYQIDMSELELYSIEDNIETNSIEYIAVYKELEELFDVDIFE